jgi:hypothetical protein
MDAELPIEIEKAFVKATKKNQRAKTSPHAAADDDASSNVMPVIRKIQRAGANFLHQIADTLNRAWITAPRGGTWYAKSVSNLLARG